MLFRSVPWVEGAGEEEEEDEVDVVYGGGVGAAVGAGVAAAEGAPFASVITTAGAAPLAAFNVMLSED